MRLSSSMPWFPRICRSEPCCLCLFERAVAPRSEALHRGPGSSLKTSHLVLAPTLPYPLTLLFLMDRGDLRKTPHASERPVRGAPLAVSCLRCLPSRRLREETTQPLAPWQRRVLPGSALQNHNASPESLDQPSQPFGRTSQTSSGPWTTAWPPWV